MKPKFRPSKSAIFGACALAVGTTMAFKPALHTFGHTMITESVLSEVGYSYGSGKAVSSWSTRLSDGTVVRFSEDAWKTVVTGAQAVDWTAGQPYLKDGVSGWIYGEINTEEAHCDNDLTGACSERIIKIRDQVITSGLKSFVTADDKFQLIHSRLMLGRALHTLQDFYAHSNYADTHPSGPIFDALTTDSAAVRTARPGSDVSTCSARAEPFNSTWTNNGGNYAFTSNGLSPATVTSGYFFNGHAVAGLGSAPDEGGIRCDHGMELLGATVSGINKDAPYSPFNPSPSFAVNSGEMSDAAAKAIP